MENSRTYDVNGRIAITFKQIENESRVLNGRKQEIRIRV